MVKRAEQEVYRQRRENPRAELPEVKMPSFLKKVEELINSQLPDLYNTEKETTMIELNEELRKTLREQPGKPLRLVDPATREAFVLLRAEDYDRLTDYDDSPWTDEERGLLRAEAVESLGWEGMEMYQDDEP